ncbi:hypothetical protein GCM10027259_07550 [Micromonospora palomenae]
MDDEAAAALTTGAGCLTAHLALTELADLAPSHFGSGEGRPSVLTDALVFHSARPLFGG